MEQVPFVTIETTLSFTVQTAVVAEVKTTFNPEVAVADKSIVFSPVNAVVGGEKEIVWARTEKVWATVGAAAHPEPPD